MKSHERAKRVIDSYLETENLRESQLYISIQLDKHGDEKFSIDYYIKAFEESQYRFYSASIRV
jgi:hypothetical protein